MRNRTILSALVVSLLLGLSPLSADPVIQRGIDVFSTLGDGKTFYDFSQRPIPAGFFCNRSKAFTGRVTFRGLPLATDPRNGLGNIDTIVERLDDAPFDDQGIAATRIQFRALSLASIAPIKTACGAFHVYLSLHGQQRVTKMTILRTQESGGDFIAPLAVDVKMTFIPVKPARTRGARKLELTGRVTFPGNPLPWSLAQSAVKGAGALIVDTNGDLIPDTRLPGPSNFLAGQSPDRSSVRPKATCSCCPYELCHADSGEQHCTTVPMCPNTWSCC
ncbi:MAG TPA: hypothetical protein VE685_00880 [Thermoanaerobaculia bacterium]|nr:hypothetical protein [Thermoanaerobaculia bacterium]